MRWEQIDEDEPIAQSNWIVLSRLPIRSAQSFGPIVMPGHLIVLFPGRNDVPKTLIFAKDDNHADEIVQIVRAEFACGNEFA